MVAEGEELRAKWDARYGQADAAAPQAAQVLREHVHLLPAAGDALDVACGLGGNAMLLAQRGLRVSAWDLSPVAIERLAQSGVAGVHAEVRDLIADPPAAQSYDVVVVSYFLDRGLFPRLIDALRPGGLLFYQTFIRDKVDDKGPGNPDFLLASNELLQLAGDLQILVYREEGSVGDTAQGFRNEAMLVGRKG